MKRNLLSISLITAAIALSTYASNANAADLAVTIKGVGDRGNVMVALYKKDDKWMGKASMGTMIAAKKEGVTVSFKDLPEGEYAVSLFVDENSNGKMDANAIGIPTEPFGFSNDAFGSYGPPSFEQAKFVVGKDKAAITITLK